MKLFKRIILNYSIRNKIFAYFILLTLLCILLLSLIFYFVSSGIIRKNTENLLVDLINQIGMELNNIFSDSYRTLKMVSNDPKIQEILRKPYPESLAELYSIELQIDNQLSFVQNYQKDIFGIYIIGANGTAYKSNFFSGIEKDFRKAWWYEKIINSFEPQWIGPHVGAFTVETTDLPLVTLGETIIDKGSGKSLGVIMVDITVDRLRELLRENLEEIGSILLLNSDFELVCGTNVDISSSEKTIIERLKHTANISGQDNKKIIKINDYLIYVKHMEVNGWSLIGMISEAVLIKDIKSANKFIVVITICLSLIALLLALYFSRKVTKPIEQLMGLMKHVEKGDFNVNMDIKTKDEIGKLGESFNKMVKKLDELVRLLFENQKKLRKAELKALEAQINPHFLYNTLDSICWLARAKRNNEIVKTVVALTKILRIGLSKGSEVIPLSDEFEHVKNYLFIQKMRYGDKLDYNIKLPEELKDYKTLKLIIQPLVENAIYHGIKQKSGRGYIWVEVNRSNGDLEIVVKDSGVGMRKEKVDLLNKSLHEMDFSKNGGYGLRNVNERIKIYFGNEYGISFSSNESKGTTVRVKIPALKGPDNV